jgi:hypothetical protein
MAHLFLRLRSSAQPASTPCLCNSDEAMVEFCRRAGGPKTLEDRNIFDMLIQRGSGEITLDLTDQQYDELRKQ